MTAWTCVVDNGPPCPTTCERQGFCAWASPMDADDSAATIEAQARRIEELSKIVQGFLDCPEIADCAPEDKDGETHQLEHDARRALAGKAIKERK